MFYVIFLGEALLFKEVNHNYALVVLKWPQPFMQPSQLRVLNLQEQRAIQAIIK